MDEQKLRDELEWLKDAYDECEEVVKLVESYLAIKGWPEEERLEVISDGKVFKTNADYAKGRNDMLRDCKLALLKKCGVEKLEKIISEVVNKGIMDDKDTATIIHDEAQAIHSAIINGE